MQFNSYRKHAMTQRRSRSLLDDREAIPSEHVERISILPRACGAPDHAIAPSNDPRTILQELG